MAYDKQLVAGKLRRSEKYLNRFRLPQWEDIPDFGLSAAGIEGGADNNRSRNKQLRPHKGNARAEQKEVLQNTYCVSHNNLLLKAES